MLSGWSHVRSTFYVNMKSDYCHQYDNIDVDLLYYLMFFQPHLCSHSRQVKSFVQTPARCMPTAPISNRTMWLSLLSQYFQDTPCWNPLGICTQRILNWGALILGATLYQQSMAGDKYFFPFDPRLTNVKCILPYSLEGPTAMSTRYPQQWSTQWHICMLAFLLSSILLFPCLLLLFPSISIQMNLYFGGWGLWIRTSVFKNLPKSRQGGLNLNQEDVNSFFLQVSGHVWYP